MATFRNVKSGVTFETDNPAPYVARPGHYQPVDVCDVCGRTFDSAQGLASHARTHDEG